MTRYPLLALLSLSLSLPPSLALAQDAPAATQPATQPAASTLSPEAEAWLDRIDAASGKLKTLQGTIRYEVVQGALGDKQVRVGSLFYDAKAPARFAVHFDRLLAGRRLIREDRWYIFDGQWMVEKMVDQKQFIKRQLVDAKADGPAVNPLTDGQGPFALPITLSKAQVVRKHKVELIAPAESDPAASVHLRFTPHVAQRGDFSQIDLWYDTATLLPLRVATLDETENETTVILSSVTVDQPITQTVFDTTPPAATDGWTVEIKPLE